MQGFLSQIFGDSFEIELHIPHRAKVFLDICLSSGNLDIDQAFSFSSISCQVMSGNISICSQITNNIQLKNKSGNIKLKNCFAVDDINIESNSVCVKLDSIKAMEIKEKCHSGIIKNSLIEAKKIFMQVSSGIIKAEKINVNTADIKASSSLAKLSLTGKREEYTLNISSSAGFCNYKNQTGSTSKQLLQILVLEILS